MQLELNNRDMWGGNVNVSSPLNKSASGSNLRIRRTQEGHVLKLKSNTAFTSDGSSLSMGTSGVEIKLLTWDQCQTISQKISFLLGRSIKFAGSSLSFAVSLPVNLAGKVVSILHLTDGARFFLLLFNMVAVQVTPGIKNTLKITLQLIGKIGVSLIQGFSIIFESRTVKASIHFCVEWILNPLDRGIRKMVHFMEALLIPLISQLSISFYQRVLEPPVLALSNWIFVPACRYLLSVSNQLRPKLEVLAERVGFGCGLILNMCSGPLNFIIDRVVTPLADRVISPLTHQLGTLIGTLIHGVISGVFENNRRPAAPQIREEEEPALSDTNM